MYMKQVNMECMSDLVSEFNEGAMFKLRRHCKKHGINRDTIKAASVSVVSTFGLGMSWCQGVYGPLPAKVPTMLGIIEYTSEVEEVDGILVLPLREDGTPYVVACYDNNDEVEYCTWMSVPGMTLNQMLEHIREGRLIDLSLAY